MKTIICGIPFEIIVVETTLCGTERFGECDVMAATIKINSHCSQQQKESTLIHEWLHAIAGCNGTSNNEDIVSVLANELYRNGFRVKIEDGEL